MERGIEVLQKELFGPGVGIERKVERCGLVALQKSPRRHAAGRFFQREVPSGPAPAGQQNDVPRCGRLGPQHERTPHGPHHAVHKGVLPEDRLFHLGGKALKAAQMLRLDVGGPFGQQTVIFHILQHFAAVGKGRFGGGILRFQLGRLRFQQFVQLFLLFQQGRVQVRQGAAGLGLWFGGQGLEFSTRAEHTVHQAFPIVCVCHRVPSVHRFLSV